MDISKCVCSGVTAVVEYDYTAKEADELDLVRGALIFNIKQLPGGWWEGTIKSTGKTGMFPDNFVRLLENNDGNTVVHRDKAAITNRRCKVIYSYTQVNDDELSLAVGDVIELLGEVEEGWWRGKLKSKVGVFPSNFVVTIEPSPIFASKRPPSTKPNPTATTNTVKSSGSSTCSFLSSNAENSSTTLHSVISSCSSSSKKLNRSSLHSSKEDLLSSTNINKLVTTTKTEENAAAPSLPPKPHREFCRVEFPYMPQNEDELYLRAGDIITIISMDLPDKGWWKGELRGKVGVFPDNFVKLIPLEDDANSTNGILKSSIPIAETAPVTPASHLTTASSTPKTNHVNNAKVFVHKSGSSSSTRGSQGQAIKRGDSFGSRDSLNDILSETGLQTGNVAAARKSLEKRNIDLLNMPDASRMPVMKSHQEKAIPAVVTGAPSPSNISATSISEAVGANNGETRKSLENLEEKTKTPPPVLSKKPILGAKGILSGLKQKVKNVEKQVTTSATHDNTDGTTGSKSAGLPDPGVSGKVTMQQAATNAVEDIDFDVVERASILPDIRAGRVKAPRRRPPSMAYTAAADRSNSNTAHLNGGDGDAVLEESVPSDENSTGDDQLVKPKPRDWQTQKAPWMEELKQSQVKKKSSPNVELHAAAPATNDYERIKILSAEANNTTSSTSVIPPSPSSSAMKFTTTNQQSSPISTSLHQPESLDSHQHPMSKSLMVSKSSHDSSEDNRMRPNSLSISKSGSSPSTKAMGQRSAKSSGMQNSYTVNVMMEDSGSNADNRTSVVHSSCQAATCTSLVQENSAAMLAGNKTTLNQSKTERSRVLQLEQRIEKLESAVLAQQRAIDELVCTLREETDRVKLLRCELDKYAQCVTQV